MLPYLLLACRFDSMHDSMKKCMGRCMHEGRSEQKNGLMSCWHPGLMTGKRLPWCQFLLKSKRMGRSRWQSLLQSLHLVRLSITHHSFISMWCSLIQSALEAAAHRVTSKTCAPSCYLLYFLGTSLNPRNHYACHPLSSAFSTCTTSDACHCSKHLSQHNPTCECVPRLLPGSNSIPDLAVAERVSEQNGLAVADSRPASPVGQDTKVRTSHATSCLAAFR